MKPDLDKERERYLRQGHLTRISIRKASAFNSTIAEIQAQRQLALEIERDQVARMIRLMPNLKSLALYLYRNKYTLTAEGFEGGLSKLGYGLDGLEGELLNSICSLKSLTTLIIMSVHYYILVLLRALLMFLLYLSLRFLYTASRSISVNLSSCYSHSPVSRTSDFEVVSNVLTVPPM